MWKCLVNTIVDNLLEFYSTSDGNCSHAVAIVEFKGGVTGKSTKNDMVDLDRRGTTKETPGSREEEFSSLL